MKKFFLLFLFFCQGCGRYYSKINSNEDSSLAGLDIDQQAYTVLNNNCSSCHDSRNMAGTNLTFVTDLSHLASSNYVTAGNPRSSTIYQRIASGSMPPTGPLDATETKVISDWITSLATTAPTPPPPQSSTPIPTPTATPIPRVTPSPTPVTNPNATFSYISKNILQKRCTSCHGGDGGYYFNTYANTLKAVKAKNANSSPLYTSVHRGVMPASGGKLSNQDIQTIYDWIQAGALNN